MEDERTLETFFSKEWASMLGGENPSFSHLLPPSSSSRSAASRLEWELDAGGGFCSAASPRMFGRIKLLFCMLKGSVLPDAAALLSLP